MPPAVPTCTRAALNRRFIRGEYKGAHRVLKSDGTIGGTALGDPAEVRRRLEAEGIEFEGGRAQRVAAARSGGPRAGRRGGMTLARTVARPGRPRGG